MGLRCFLGHGASGDAASMTPFVAGLQARGLTATAIDLPKRKAEDAVPAFHLVVPSAPDVVVGGHSYGGRVASLAAAEPERRTRPSSCSATRSTRRASRSAPRPGSPTGRPSAARSCCCPGESDPFARIELLRAAVPLLPDAELVTYPRLGHTLKPVLDDVLDRVARFLEPLSAA